MPRSVATKERFDEVVAILEKRARHLLAREGRVGSGTRFSGKSRMADDELLVRVQRLQQSCAEFKQEIIAIMGQRAGLFEKSQLWPQTIQIERALSYDRLFNLADDDLEERLLSSHDQLKAIRSQLDSVLLKTAEQIDPTLARLTQEEITILADTANDDHMEDGDSGTYPKDALDLVADLIGLIDLADACASEARYVLTGRFDPWKGAGRPIALRGDRLSAQLLGIAESLGATENMNLRLSRGKNIPPHSAADAVSAALTRCMDVKDPTSRAILEEAPKTYDAIVRRLVTKFGKSKILSKDRALGQAFSRRFEDRT